MSQAFDENSSRDEFIDKELQVRLMNLVMGEASDFERDQLQLLMEQRTELAAYYQHLGHLHGLLCEVGSGEMSMDADAASDSAWRLPNDKREKLLAVLDGTSPNPTTQVGLINVLTKPRRVRSRWYAAALALTAAASLLVALMLPSVQSARLARRFRGGTDSAYYLNDDVQSTPAVVDRAETILGVPSQTSGDRYDRVQEFAKQAAPARSLVEDDFGTHEVAKGKDAVRSRAKGFENSETQSVDAPYDSSVARDKSETSGLTASDWDDVRKAAIVPAKPGSNWYENKSANDLSSTINTPESEVAQWDRDWVDSNPQPTTATPTDGEAPTVRDLRTDLSRDSETAAEAPLPPGTILLGGIRRSIAPDGRLEKEPKLQAKTENEVAASMEVSPRIIINEEEENVLLGSQPVGRPSQAVIPTPEQEPDEKSLAESKRLDVLGIDQSTEKENVQQQTGQQGHQSGQPSERWYKLQGGQQGGQQSGHQPDQQGAQPSFDDQVMAIGVPETMGADGNLFGDTQIEFIEDLDLVIVKGSKRDVERTLEVIDGIKEGKEAKQEGVEVRSLDSSHMSIGQVDSALKSALKKRGFNQGKQVDGERNDQLEALRERFRRREEGWIDSMRRVDDGALASPQKEIPSQDQSQPDPDLIAKNAITAGRKFTPAPTPESVSSTRGRVAVERKPVALQPAQGLDEQSAATLAFSTFSLHVSDVSFKLAQAALAQGQWPEAAKIRIEEFVNALDYHDPLPTSAEKVACRVEQAIHPFLMQRNLLRVSMRTAATGRAQNTPLRLTLLLDNSGSMERPDRRQAVVRAFHALIKQLKAADQVTLISFANTPRLLADKIPGNQGEMLVKLIESLPSEGGTNIEAALQLAREKAVEQKGAGAQNRIVLLTDGAVNLGNANPNSLAQMVTQLRDAGIAFDAAGISALDLNDEVLEALTRQGDGRYYLLDSAEAVGEGFAAQIAGALRPSAQNVKVQVEFNPQRVGRYKLLGFEKHRLNKEDFRNDKVDAAEMAAAEAGVAMYQFEIKPNGSGDVGSVSVRFRDIASGQMIERRWPIPYESSTPRLDQAAPSMKLAASAALFAAKLGGGPLADSVDLAELQKLFTNLSEQFAGQPRVGQLRAMIDQAQAISSK